MEYKYREIVYKNVKALVFMQGLEMADVEKETGHAPGFLSRKNNTLDIDTFLKLCKILGVSPADMIERDYTEEMMKQNAINAMYKAVDDALEFLDSGELVEMIAFHLSSDGGEGSGRA